MNQDYNNRNHAFIERKGRTVNDKNNNTVGIIILVVALLTIGGIVFYNRDRLFNFKKNNEHVELKYTELNTKIKEGIYITDVSEVVENAMPSIVAITSKSLISSGKFPFWGQNQYSEGAGSGIIVSKTSSDLMILTNNHVVEGASELTVQFINEKSYDAKIVGTSEKKDVAIISIPLNKIDSDTINAIRIATIGDSKSLKVGNGVIAIGNALGYGQAVTTGVVSAIDRRVSIDGYTNKMIQIDAAINGGNSGGALLNNKGEVVGINSAKYSSNGLSSSASIEGMGFAIPITDVKDLITALMNGEDVNNDVTIGIEGYIITEDYSEDYHIPTGFYITRIVNGSNADKAKLEIGNIISKADDVEIKVMEDFDEVLSTKKKGDKIKLTINYPSGKSYKEKTVNVTLS